MLGPKAASLLGEIGSRVCSWRASGRRRRGRRGVGMLLAHVEGSLASSASSDCNGESWEAVAKPARLQEPDSSVSGGGMGVSCRSGRVRERSRLKNQHAGFLWSHACISGGTFNRKRRAGSRLQSCGRAGQQDVSGIIGQDGRATSALCNYF